MRTLLVLIMASSACGGADPVPDRSVAPPAPATDTRQEPAAEAEAPRPRAGPELLMPYVRPTDAEIAAACQARGAPPTGPLFTPPDWYLDGEPSPRPPIDPALAAQEAGLANQILATMPATDPATCPIRLRLAQSLVDAGQRDEAIRQLAQIVREHPAFADMPEVFHRLARLLAQAGTMDRSRQVYMQLLRNHPSSRYVPYAYLSFGDFFFRQGDMNAARQFYERVLAFPDPALRPYTSFMLGWTHFNLQQLQQAESMWVDALTAASVAPPPPLAREIGGATKEALCAVRTVVP